MKTTNIYVAVICCLTILSFSCSSEDGESDNPNNSAFFAAKVDNQSYPTADIQFTSAKFVSSTKMIQIIGQPSDQKESIVISILPFGDRVATASDWKPGTYDFDPVHITNLEYLASGGYAKWNGSSYDSWATVWDYVKTGKIIIETNTGTHIKGTFFFDAVRLNNDGSYDGSNIKKITEGKFDLDIKMY